MRFSFPILSILLLLSLSTASPTPVPSLAHSARGAITSPPSVTAPPSRRDDSYTPSLDIPKVSITPVSLDLPSNTCTAGFSAYATPGLDGYVPPQACNSLWPYFPNFAAAIAFSTLFGILTITHIGQAILYRNGFCWVIAMAALWETAAYISRAFGSKMQQSYGIAIVAQILVLVAPLWINAFAYMVFARIVHFYSPTHKVWFFSPSVLTLIFVTLDIASFVIQLVGGGMAGPGSSAKLQRTGLDIYMGGIGMQEGFIVLFLGLVIKFHRDQLQAEKFGRSTADKIAGWRWLIYALYGCLLAITIRIIYRLAEFSAGLGANNPLPGNEPVLYVLESTPMFLAILVWNIVHPGRFIHGEDAKMPPSWLSRHLCCCCCCRKRNRKLGATTAHHHHRLASDAELEENQELHPLSVSHRGRVAAIPDDPFVDAPSRGSSPDRSVQEQLRLRPPPNAESPREVSPDPPSYTAYRS